jgi:multimeric flavodoxin WrbA
MKITVINGSPKTHQSITLQHIYFLEKKNPEDTFDIIHIGKKISSYEKKKNQLEEVADKMLSSDAVIWSFPVYYALVPSQLKRFIELLFERYPTNHFQGKYATSFSTSINFLDHTAHNYMQGISEDLGFLYINSYSAHMDDFFHENKRGKELKFYEWFKELVCQKISVPKKYNIRFFDSISYEPDFSKIKIPPHTPQLRPKVLVLTDAKASDVNLKNMTRMFESSNNETVVVKNINDIYFKNGCLGCCTCGYENKCVQKDDFTKFYNENLKTADTIIIAGTIKDHYLSSTWKKFFDRSFFNGHVPVLQGKRMGFIVSGPLSQIQNLRETLEALLDNWHLKNLGIVTDEHESEQAITDHIKAFTKNIEIAEKKDLDFAPSFYSVGGGKIFRDFIFNSSAVFKADHLFYKKMGIYKDFPQRQLRKRISNAVFSFFVSIKPVRKQIYKKFIPGMVAPYKKALKKL